MLIKMICGTYGAVEEGVVTAKTSQSPPFEVEEEKARWLIASGYAALVELSKSQPKPDAEESTEPDEGQSVEPDREETALDDCSVADLRKMAKSLGVSAAGTKEQLIARIKAAAEEDEEQEGEEETGAEDEAPPALQPAAPV